MDRSSDVERATRFGGGTRGELLNARSKNSCAQNFPSAFKGGETCLTFCATSARGSVKDDKPFGSMVERIWVSAVRLAVHAVSDLPKRCSSQCASISAAVMVWRAQWSCGINAPHVGTSGMRNWNASHAAHHTCASFKTIAAPFGNTRDTRPHAHSSRMPLPALLGHQSTQHSTPVRPRLTHSGLSETVQ